MRIIYSFLFYLSLPYVLLRLYWRSRAQPAYAQRVGERFGFYQQAPTVQSLWLHACSLGEVNAARPLIEALLTQYPQHVLWVTTMTPTGSAQVLNLFKDRVRHCYIPYDLPDAVNRFLRQTNPRLAIIMETEIWPNLWYYAHQRAVKLCMANARISPKALVQYRKIKYFLGPYLNLMQSIGVQSALDAARFKQLGVADSKIKLTGNLKYDLMVDQNLVTLGKKWRSYLGEDKPIWIAASTHPGEEEIILQAHKAYPAARLILVPRHPERFAVVVRLAEAAGFSVQRRSQIDDLPPDVDVLVGDSLGEMFAYYACADVAFVGGSLVNVGGHNLLEPAALGLPILTGSYMQNCTEIWTAFTQAQACQVIHSAPECVEALKIAFAQQQLLGARAHAVYTAHQGAVSKQLALCLPFLDFS